MSLSQDLAGFFGTEGYYYHPLFRSVKYTDGIKYLNSVCGWIVTDMLAILVHHPKLKGQEFVCVKFRKNADGSAVMTYDDGNENVLHEQKYDTAIVDLTECKFFYTDGVLMLASEY